jgi:tetratricopeptide (TPR) repeat protein
MVTRRALVVALVLLPAGGLAQRRRDLSIDQLFEALKLAPTDEAARAVEAQIWQAWLQQGSPAVQLLMRRGMRHLHARSLDDALEDFDAVIALAPEVAEGWNKRATVYFLRGEHDNAARDIAETLAREPRHFGALAGLSQVHEARGDLMAALRAFEAAIAIHPRLPGAEQRLKDLRRRALGEGI